MDLDESILQNQYIMDDMLKEPIKYIYCIVLDDSSFLFTSDVFSDLKVDYEILIETKPIWLYVEKGISLGKIDYSYFDYNNFEQSYKYFEEI